MKRLAVTSLAAFWALSSTASFAQQAVAPSKWGPTDEIGAANYITPARVAEAAIIRVWSGFEGITRDHLPVLGPSATTPGLIHAFGFSGHGFALSPGVGSIVAELATDGESEVPLAPLGIARFTASNAEQLGR